MRNTPSKNALGDVGQSLKPLKQEREKMFLVAEKASPNGQRCGVIYMRADGLFEGHIYRRHGIADSNDMSLQGWSDDYEVCAVTETLPRAKTIVDEELGLSCLSGCYSRQPDVVVRLQLISLAPFIRPKGVGAQPVPSPSRVWNAAIGSLRRLWRKTNSSK
jgi:hypothetical protein